MSAGFVFGFVAGVVFVLLAWAYLEGLNAEPWNKG